MKSVRTVFVVAMMIALCGLGSATDYTMRKAENRIDSTNPLSHQIVDADCVYEAGAFVLKSLPSDLPSLFTIRFTAPADYTAGDAFVVGGKELSVRTPGMINAASDIFRSGAVVHIDIDLEREIAFCWQGAGSSGGVIPNISLNEQFAGFYDENGDKVYVRTFKLPLHTTSNKSIYFSHGIANIKTFTDVNYTVVLPEVDQWAWFDNFCIATTGSYFRIMCNPTQIEVYYSTPAHVTNTVLKITMYYTCTDR